MASPGLTIPPNYASFFQRRVVMNAQYWCDFVANRAADVSALDGEREGILTAITFALERPDAWRWVYGLLVSFSPYMERRGHWEIWNALLNRAVQVARQAQDLAGAVTLSILLARLWQRRSRPKETITHYRRAIRLARFLGDGFSEARACSNLGYLYTELGRWQRAEILCCHALTIFERLDSDHGRAHTENHLGILYTRQNLWEKAQHHLERACALWQAMDDPHGLMRGFINLGMLHIDTEHPDKALSFLEKALQQAKLTGEEVEIGKIYVNMGVAHRLKGEVTPAEANARQAETIFRRFSHSLGLAEVWGNLGLIFLDQGKWQEARFYLKASLKMWRLLDNKFGEIKTLLYLVEYDLAKGNKRQAVSRLAKLEKLTQRSGEKLQYDPLQLLLSKYHRQLIEKPKKRQK